MLLHRSESTVILYLGELRSYSAFISPFTCLLFRNRMNQHKAFKNEYYIVVSVADYQKWSLWMLRIYTIYMHFNRTKLMDFKVQATAGRIYHVSWKVRLFSCKLTFHLPFGTMYFGLYSQGCFSVSWWARQKP